MRWLRLWLVLLTDMAWGQCGIIDRAPGPDFRFLYERISRSSFVVKGRVLEQKSIRFTPPPPKGFVFKVEVNEVLCRQSDFEPRRTLPVDPGRVVFLFVPSHPPGDKLSDLIPGLRVPGECLLPGKQYLLFLYKYPDQEALISANELDPGVTYYRAFDGSSGAEELPDDSLRGTSYDHVTGLLPALISLCEAVRPPEVKEKIQRLTALREKADPQWRDSVDAALANLRRMERVGAR